ncbi:hypothetical protein RSK20926_01717 [Roseobacter sp. SK209-2-6]|uniref:hypothetical protein n=1 Tax=Roseobacter sp. SK209-2-6 TaxID=388739 RepID=UPI0000F3F516|nr:hypothetical protein [Roseobacter sp. SK209-2-6]EBA14704.1 hypothetical protein RSK20926_01717 [Roseobacter sp. SK209-2-6]
MAEAALTQMSQTSLGPNELLRIMHQFAQPVEGPKNGALPERLCPTTLSATILQEIREIVLPRHLSVQIDHEIVADLCVAQRRLSYFALCNGENVEGIIGGEPEHPEEAATIFATRLKRLEELIKGQPYTISRSPCTMPSNTGSCSVDMLASHLDRIGNQQPIESFHALAQAHADCWMRCDIQNTVLETSGQEPLLHQLKAVRDAFSSSATQSLPAKMPPSQPECLLLPISSEQKILVTTDQNGRFLSLHSKESAKALLEEWSRQAR